MDELVKIDFEPIANVAINLLDKLEKAVGWCLAPKGEKKDFEDGVNYFIEEIKKDKNCPTVVKAAKISNARKILREYKNQYDIVKIAIDNMEEVSMPEKIDDNWLEFFMDKCKNISNDNIKIMFGKLLTEECKSCGKIDKSLIHALSIMSPQNAKAFRSLSKLLVKCTVDNEEELLIILDSMKTLKDIGLSYNDISELCSIGLIEAKASYPDQYALIFDDNTEKEVELEYHGEIVQFTCSGGSFPYGSILLTKNGTMLMQTLIPEKYDGYLKKIKKMYRRNFDGISCNKDIRIDMRLK